MIASSPAVFGDDGVIAYQDKSACQNAYDCYYERGELETRMIAIFKTKRGRRRENDVTPLLAIYAANSLRTVFVRLIWWPRIWVDGTHAQIDPHPPKTSGRACNSLLVTFSHWGSTFLPRNGEASCYRKGKSKSKELKCEANQWNVDDWCVFLSSTFSFALSLSSTYIFTFLAFLCGTVL